MAQGQTRESIKMALDTLRTNKLRSSLTILGIVIGVTTVITISSVISGLNNRVSEWVSSLGNNVFWVFHMPVIGVQPTLEQLARKKLTLDDVMALRQLPHVVAADGGHQHVKPLFRVGDVAVKYNGKKVAGTILQGSTTEIAEVTDLVFTEGRLWTDAEDDRAAHVVVLGHDTAEELFGTEDPIGKDVAVESGLYTVIGVLDKRKQPFGGGKNPNDNAAFFPLTTFHNLHPEDLDMWVSVKYDDPKNKALVQEEIRELLRIRRKVKVEKEDDFEIFGPDSISKLWNQLTGGLVIFMIAVSSVGLMVGGVGVMNIMLVSVTEHHPDPVHHRSCHTLRSGRNCGHIAGRGAHLDRVFPAHWPARHSLGHMGDHRVHGFVRDWPCLRHLSGLESRQSRPHRGASLRISAIEPTRKGRRPSIT
jgi:putative ABC transport system permease protein